MGITQALIHDHRELRRQLARLEHLLATPGCSCRPIRAECHALAGVLGAHIAREEAALAAYGGRLGARLRRSPPDHLDEVRLLHDVERLAAHPRCPAHALALHLAPAIRALRAHMREEEEDVFPLVDHIETAGRPAVQACGVENRGGCGDECPSIDDDEPRSLPADR